VLCGARPPAASACQRVRPRRAPAAPASAARRRGCCPRRL
jgi:hypothetical protein